MKTQVKQSKHGFIKFDNDETRLYSHHDILDPTSHNLNEVKKDHWVKVWANPGSDEERIEKFWILVTEVTDDAFIGKVDNDLKLTDKHGLSVDEVVSVPKDCVYAILH